ncbi:hypothetical protein MNV49_005210 [Pseudohyphozyma bogoriensis]|nr:hypothetical protein MNV49_005210 [Pseudohyphozyma bogoriensis]
MSYASHSVTKTLVGQQGVWPAFQKAAAEKKPVIGSWMMLPGQSIARMHAQMGYNFVLVDCEHGDIDDAAMHVTVGTIAAHGCSPIIRIPAPENFLVKRALDTGAHGIMCPMMSTAEEAKALVSYAKFPVPKEKLAADPSLISGIRGVGSPFCAAAFGQSLPDYIATANQNTFICVQIESAEGLANCEEIAKVPGIDALLVGPNDLCSSLGFVAGDHPNIPEVQDAIARVLKAAHDAGKLAGMFCTSGEQIVQRAAQGFDFMNLGFDVLAIGAWNATELQKVQHLM